MSVAMFVGCDKLEDVFGEKENNQLQQEFQVIKEGLNGYDELLINNSTTICYKAQENGLPSSLMILIDNEEIQDCYNYIIFDDKGVPSYMNINNQSVYVENVRGNKYDLLIINSDKTFFQIKDAESEVDIENYWSNQSLTRSGYTQSNAQNAVCLLNHLIGGVTMIEGGAAMLVGCAMLVPGANIAVGATIAIAGAATFISGALLTARATDLLVSDGSHTDGFDAASGLLGAVGTAAGQGTVTQKVVDILLNTGYDGLQEVLDNTTDEEEIREKAKKIIEGRLSTGSVEELDYENRKVKLNGYISNKINSNDNVGIYISTDPSALYVDNCGYAESNNSGTFSVSFDYLDDKKVYYYRSYYYSTDFNEYYVSGVKSFVMPGVETGGYEALENNDYKIYFTPFVDKVNQPLEAGICYSTSEYEPTIEGPHSSIKISENIEYGVNIELTEPFYYYRAYLATDEKIFYGDTKELCADENELLVRFYNETIGDQWINNTHWCTNKPASEWFGVYGGYYYDEHFRVGEIRLPNNNLSGTPIVYGFSHLNILDIRENKFSELTISNCNRLDSLNIENCVNLTKFDVHNSKINTITTKGTNIADIKITHSSFGYNREYSIDFENLQTLKNIEIRNCNFTTEAINLKNNSNIESIIIEGCNMSCGDMQMSGSKVKNVTIRNCQGFDPGYSFNGFNGGEFEYILIDNCMKELGQHFFDGEGFKVKMFEISNTSNLGRIFWRNISADEIIFKNVQFESQGGWVEDGANVPIIRLDNFYLGGGFGGRGTTTYMTNGTVEDWWAMDGYYVISACTIEGIYISSLSGSSDAIAEYLRKQHEGR